MLQPRGTNHETPSPKYQGWKLEPVYKLVSIPFPSINVMRLRSPVAQPAALHTPPCKRGHLTGYSFWPIDFIY